MIPKLPNWSRILILLAGVALTVYDTVGSARPNFPRLVLYAAMMGLLSGDTFEKIFGFMGGIFGMSSRAEPPSEGDTTPDPPVKDKP